MSRSLAARSRASLIALAVLAAVANSPGEVLAQKGKPPGGGGGGSVPPGTIYYVYGPDLWGMKADGSGKSLVLPGYGDAYPVLPSNLVYGADRHRLWLGAETVPGQYYPYSPDPSENSTEQRELFAYRRDPGGAVRKVQITNLFPGIQVDFNNHSHQWSNDGTDSFVSFVGIDARLFFLTGNPADARKAIFRVRVSGSDLNAAADAGGDLLLSEADLEEVVSDTDTYEQNLLHAWSPSGDRLVYSLRGADGYMDLFLKDLTSGQTTLLRDLGTSPWTPPFRWSPDGAKIVISGGSVWTIDAATGALLQMVLQEGKSSYNWACWSPDASQFVVREFQRKVNGNTYAIHRLPATGGSLTPLSGDLNVSIHKFPISWVSDTPAAP